MNRRELQFSFKSLHAALLLILRELGTSCHVESKTKYMSLQKIPKQTHTTTWATAMKKPFCTKLLDEDAFVFICKVMFGSHSCGQKVTQSVQNKTKKKKEKKRNRTWKTSNDHNSTQSHSRCRELIQSIAFAQPTNMQPVLLAHGALSSSKGQHCVL